MPYTDHILLVDDDPQFVDLIQIAFQDGQIANPVQVVGSGAEAMRYLMGQGRYADRSLHPMPILMLVDLRMPNLGGLELLRCLRGQEMLAHLPVVVLTGSAFGDELARALDAGATDFHVKPFSYRELVELVQAIHNQFLKHAPA